MPVLTTHDRAVQAVVVLFWLIIAAGGLLVVKEFMSSLSNTLPGPPGSPSQRARAAYNADFPGEASLMLTVLVSASDGQTPLVNRSTSLDAALRPDTPLSVAAANVSHSLRNLSLSLGDQCNVSFESYWDLQEVVGLPPAEPDDAPAKRTALTLVDRALGFFAEGPLFNDDSRAAGLDNEPA